MAQRAADKESDYQEAWRAGSDYAEAAEALAAHRREALAILKERREVDDVKAPALCHAVRVHVATLREAMAEAREQMAEALESIYGEDEKNAFCDGAGIDAMPGTS